ncbi:MAG: NADPH-dependent assimilatory sulfite reductase hemoprotein subunit [Burkholderiales bacterium]|nr:NADPH-dependent assimilatory sulfite reductase hemoprotein subunit [Burkholderiales bacterium]
MTQTTPPTAARSEVEKIKEASNYLRGTIAAGLADPLTGSIAEKDTQLLKFHGSYMQDDRDLRLERQKQKLEPAYQFMIRLRMAGGVCTPAQWLKLDDLAQRYGGNTIRLTTRQTVQYHNVLKHQLRPLVHGIDEVAMTSIAACGDVNRNVLSSSNPFQSPAHQEVTDWCLKIDQHLRPQTTAYREIWLGEKRLGADQEDHEPIYGKLYLPRKFKIAIAIPPNNDVDVFANDLGFIAIIDAAGKLQGFNVAIGGGMGMTHGDAATYPRAATVIGYCPADKVVEVAENVLKVQRDFGDRGNRKHARLKYTIDDRSVEWYRDEVNRYLGWPLEAARPYAFTTNGDQYGWLRGSDERWYLTLFIQNGRIKDWHDYPLMTGLREIAKVHSGDFRITANQNLIIGGVTDAQKPQIEALVKQYRLLDGSQQSALRVNSMACVAFPTCGLALAESERYLPELVTKLEDVLREAGLANEPITIRMTGCPNGCARPYLAEIGLVGRSPGKYNLYLGAGFTGDRLNKLYKESVGEEQILAELTPIIQRYAKERETDEKFGDFVVRKGYVKAVVEASRDFHG